MILKIGIIILLLLGVRYVWYIETQTKRMKSNLKPGDKIIYYLGEERYLGVVVEVNNDDNTAIIEIIDELHNVSIDNLYPCLTFKYN